MGTSRGLATLAMIVAVVLGGCGGMDITPTSPSTVAAEPVETPLEFLPEVHADGYKDVLIDTLNATCLDGDGKDDRLWTCSSGGEVAISFYGPNEGDVSAFRVVMNAPREGDRRSWLRGYASIINVEVFEWVYDHFGSNETAKVGGVWVHMSHDTSSDGVLISAKDPGT